jgi:hypothetical protein
MGVSKGSVHANEDCQKCKQVSRETREGKQEQETSTRCIFLTNLRELLLEYSQDELLHFAFELRSVRPESSQTHNLESTGTNRTSL